MSLERTALSNLKLSLHEIYVEKFRRKNFSFITIKDGKRHIKQEEALNMQGLIAFLEQMIPNLDEIIEHHEEKNQ